MEDWIKIDAARPPDNALVVWYVPFARYVWSSGRDYDQIKDEFPAASHWKLVTNEPPSE